VKENPSSWLAERLGEDFELLEVSYEGVERFLRSFKPEKYDALLHIGVHGGAHKLHLERFGANRTCALRDVRGVRGRNSIDPEGPTRIESTLWPRKVPKDFGARDQVRMSRSAGSYLCNYLLYRSLQEFPDLKVGFLHVPLQEKIGLEDQLACTKLILEMVRTSGASKAG
jgi:pyrrolidone-carboxylate peptidase